MPTYRVSGSDRQSVIRKVRANQRRYGKVATIKSVKYSSRQGQRRGQPVFDVNFTTRKRKK